MNFATHQKINFCYLHRIARKKNLRRPKKLPFGFGATFHKQKFELRPVLIVIFAVESVSGVKLGLAAVPVGEK